ncbi:MAG: hypothetical protein LBE12_19050 [Planctomycetaceae bacterium]|nr:hypothetical protein [Planctomycetaceae bacterium]
MKHFSMKHFSIFFIIGFILFYLDVIKTERLTAQDQRLEQRDRNRNRGDRPDRQPWMPGGGVGNDRPPWLGGGVGNDRPPRMDEGVPGGERSRQNSAERNERSLGMLRSMDTNGNGKLEQNEIPEYRRGFVSMIVTQMGGNPNKTIDLAELARKASTTSARSPQTSSSLGSSSDSAKQTITDPLVPYFGEKEESQVVVLAFGQREPEEKTAAAVTTSSAVVANQSDRILRSAREIMNKYDKNKNGTLDKDKGEWINSLPFKADTADKNRDGRISMTELLDTLGGKANVTTGAAAVSTRQSAAYDRLPVGMPDWFFAWDNDLDGQLSMLEYVHGQSWTEKMAEEFQFLDRNNDGVATAAEIIETLKQYDEEKRLKEEQAKRDAERRKGVMATNSTTAVPQPEGQPSPPPPLSSSSPSSSPSSSSLSPVSPPSSLPPPVPPSPAATPPSGGVPPAVPLPPPPSSSETSSNWRPSGVAPPATPSTTPYSSGTAGSSDSERRQRNNWRSGSSRSRGR